jgi:hypothetical protein
VHLVMVYVIQVCRQLSSRSICSCSKARACYSSQVLLKIRRKVSKNVQVSTLPVRLELFHGEGLNDRQCHALINWYLIGSYLLL